MASPALSLIRDPAAWDAFLLRHGGHLLQSWAWGELKGRFGWRAERWVMTLGGEPVAGAQLLLRRLLPGMQIAYIPRGPVGADPAFLRQLIGQVRTRGPFLLKVEPDWLRGNPRDGELQAAGGRPSPETIQPAATIRIDLTQDLDSILAGMKSKWRYNIRLAEKKGVLVREGTAADLPAFMQLSRLTAERDRFAIHSPQYYACAFDLLASADRARLLIAEYAGQPLAMIFITLFGREAIYLYGASGNEHRNVMPNHALHWAAIQMAKQRGCARYDLWGVPAAAQAGDDHLPGSLYQFKQGFGGQVVHYSGAWDWVTAVLPHRLYTLARRVRRTGWG